MFISSSVSRGLEFWLVSHTSMYQNSEISSNWPNDLLGINLYKTLESCW